MSGYHWLRISLQNLMLNYFTQITQNAFRFEAKKYFITKFCLTLNRYNTLVFKEPYVYVISYDASLV